METVLSEKEKLCYFDTVIRKTTVVLEPKKSIK